jgi:glutaredoxin
MTKHRAIVIVSARSCRRSRAVLAYLERQGFPFTHVTAESSEGQALIGQHGLRASPGILVDGTSVSPFDLLIPPACQIDLDAAQQAFGLTSRQQTRMDTDDKKTRS